MKKTTIGIFWGVVAKIVDVITMLIQKLPWHVNISAFTFWIIIGFFIATTNINLKETLKWMAISLMLLIPLTFTNRTKSAERSAANSNDESDFGFHFGLTY